MDDVKMLSLSERVSRVRLAFREYEPMHSETYEPKHGYWVADVYDDHLIACNSEDEKCYRVGYTITDGDVTFEDMATWQLVEKEWSEVVGGDEVKTVIGGEVKALGNGKVGGYLVKFGDPKNADFVGDYFTKDTDFDIPADGSFNGTIRFNHGLDPVLKGRKLGTARAGIDDAGVWIEGVLNQRDEYEQAIYALIEQGKVGWSSAAAPHLVDRKPVGKAYHVTSWPLIPGDMTITHTPADYRQVVTPLKSLSMVSLSELKADEVQPEAVPEDVQTSEPAEPETPVVTDVIAIVTDYSPSEEGETMTNVIETLPEVADISVEIAEIKSAVASLTDVMMKFADAPAIKRGGVQTPAPTDTKTDTPVERAVKMFNTYIRKGATSEVKATLVEGTAANGGFLVPEQYSMQMVAALRYASILRAAGARIIPISGTDTYKVPTITDMGAATLTAESAAFNQAEPTFAEITFTPYKYTRLSKATDELLADSRFPIESVLMEQATHAFAAAENTAFVTGTGSAQPQGVVTGSSLGKTAAGASAITADEIVDLYHSLGDLYRQNAVWLMNDSTLALVRKLKDTTNQYIWQPGLQAGHPSLILGRPVYTISTMPAVATGNKSVLFGDMSYFWVADFMGLEMMRLNELYAASGEVGFRWFKRVDSHVMLSAAIKHLIQA